jgi:fermentation-respiration switch protein FrsA (DUF1100 family)
MLKIIRIFIYFVAGITLAILLLQHKLIFFPEKLPKEFQFQFDSQPEEVNFIIDRTNINGLFFDAGKEKEIVLYFHGNAGSLRTWGYVGEELFEKLKRNILLIDYRGFGKSEGFPGEKKLYSDAQYIYDLTKKSYPEDRIIVYGRSIGTCIAVDLASKNNPGFLVLESPLTNIKDLAKKYFPFLPTFLIRYKFDNSSKIQDVTCPIYLLHGDSDEIIPYKHSLRLQEHIRSKNRLFTLRGGHHNDLSDFEMYDEILKEIFETANDNYGLENN